MKTFLLFLFPLLALAQSPSIARTDRPRSPVLIQLKAKASLLEISENLTKEQRGLLVYDTLRKVALESQGPVLQWLEQKGIRYRRFYITNAIAAYGMNEEQIKEASRLAQVEMIRANLPIRFIPPATREQLRGDQKRTRGIEENLVAIGAPKVWEMGFKGQDIVVAGQDTGIQWDHPALKAHYRGTIGNSVEHGYNWHDSIHEEESAPKNDCGYDSPFPCDDHGHGTHTVGTIVGDDNAGNQIGMAPQAKWIGCRNMNGGIGSAASYLECFEWFLAPYLTGANPLTDGRPEKAPHVINNSWECTAEESCKGGEFLAVLNALKSAGIIVVASAGNSGPTCESIKTGPAFHSDASISVGAVNHESGNIAVFSSRGPSKFDQQIGPDVSAPGVEIRSSIPGNKFAGAGWSGTSMAGPHAVGLVALVLSANPSLIGKVDTVAGLLTKNAAPKTSTQKCGGVSGDKIPNNTFGYGIIDSLATVKAAIQ